MIGDRDQSYPRCPFPDTDLAEWLDERYALKATIDYSHLENPSIRANYPGYESDLDEEIRVFAAP
jgi:hypothetical protein